MRVARVDDLLRSISDEQLRNELTAAVDQIVLTEEVRTMAAPVTTHDRRTVVLHGTHPTLDVDLEAAYNAYTSVDLHGALQNPLGLAYVRLDHNPIAHVDIAGCVQITELDLRATALSAAEQDTLLATLDELGRARLGPGDPTPLVVDLQDNVSPSALGRAHAVSLASKGWTVRTSFWTEAP